MGVDWGQLGSIGVEGVQWGLLIMISYGNYIQFMYSTNIEQCIQQESQPQFKVSGEGHLFTSPR